MKQLNATTGRALVDAFEQRSVSVKQFCEAQGISYAVLKYWRSRIAELDAQDVGSFVQIEAASPTPADVSRAAAVAILPNGVRIAFEQSGDVTATIVAALSRC